MVTKSILRSPFKFFIQQLNCHLMWLIKSPGRCLAAIISVEKAECRSSVECLLKFSITTVKEEHTPLDLCPWHGYSSEIKIFLIPLLYTSLNPYPYFLSANWSLQQFSDCLLLVVTGMDFHELLDIPHGDRRKYHDDVSVMVVSLEGGEIWRSSG